MRQRAALFSSKIVVSASTSSGVRISSWGRICAVADVFDAVTSERPYKPAFPNEEALQLLRDGRGKHFDPRVVDVFFECLDEILAIQDKYKDEP